MHIKIIKTYSNKIKYVKKNSLKGEGISNQLGLPDQSLKTMV